MTYSNPDSLADALEQLARGDVNLLAGGTDFYPSLQDSPPPVNILDITRISQLSGIEKDNDIWIIGAATSWSDIIRADHLPEIFDGLKAAGREIGSVQIQNTATIAGNLCNASPAADGVPPLLALDASVEISAAAGQRRLPLGAFITGNRETALGPGEMVTAIRIPDHPVGTVSGFAKLGSRSYLVISIAMIAITLIPDKDANIAEARIAVGACTPVATRLPALETALKGLPMSGNVLPDVVQPGHLAPLSPIDDVRASAGYRLDAVEEMLRRLLAELSCGGDKS